MLKPMLHGLICAGLFFVFVGHSLNAETPTALKAVAALPDSSYLVREVVYNELHDHDSHGYWRYWIQRHVAKGSRGSEVVEQVETPEGPVSRTELSNGHALSREALETENARIQHLLSSPVEQAQHRREYAEDEHRIGSILALLPEAFLYEPAQIDGANYHLRFHPNPAYPAHSSEARIFHAMGGDLWISMQNKHLVRLDGKLQQNVDFGYGVLGRLYKDGWFRLDRTNVGSGMGNGDWKTKRLEVHLAGRAMLFKTISRETSEERGGFTLVPSGLSLQQAAMLIGQPIAPAGAHPASLATSR